MRFIAHRGAWWPRREEQNLQAAVTHAFAQGWGAEVDVWDLIGEALVLGHDYPVHELRMPTDEALWNDEPLFLHMKMPQENTLWKVRLLCDVLREAGKLNHSFLFWSPNGNGICPKKELAEFGVKQLLPIDSPEVLETALQNPEVLAFVHGFWLEQPDCDWVTELTVAQIRHLGKSAWVVSPELHDRVVDLRSLSQWKEADGICTDTPHLLEQLLNEQKPRVHPVDPWWL